MAGIEALWYQRNWRHLLLLPASWLFGAMAALRRTLYRHSVLRSFKLSVPVIVIGNISVGGTGKTPLTLKLAQQLSNAGRHPVIISRGFGGNKAQQAVTPGSSAEEVGDEPKLMALREPVSRLASVDAVVINGGKNTPGQYSMHLSGDIFYHLNDPKKTATALDFKNLRIHAIAGIGHPQRYFDHLSTLGLTVTPHAFPDHHPYTQDELIYPDCDALLLTEKDAVKCAAFADDKYWVLRVDAQIDPALTEHLLRKIATHGR